jgi:hypothetical protein
MQQLYLLRHFTTAQGVYGCIVLRYNAIYVGDAVDYSSNGKYMFIQQQEL